jgi:5,10-methylenetetrahydromethanopterin reductase
MAATRFGLTILPSNSIETQVEFARKAEGYGIDFVWIPDENPSPPFRDVFLSLAAVATQTDHIRLGTSVCNPYSRHPALIAVAILTLDEISNGRAVLGLGAGGSLTLNPLGIKRWNKPLLTMKQAAESIRELFTGREVTYEGQMVSMNRLRLYEKPRSSIPIYFGARGPQMLRLTGRLADGGLILTSKGYLEFAISQIREGASSLKRSADSLDIAGINLVGVSDDVEAVEELVKPSLTHQIPDCPAILLEKTGIGREAAIGIRKARTESGVEEASRLITKQMIRALNLIGRPEDVIERLVAQVRLGVTQIVFSPPYGKTSGEGLKLIGEVIIPAVKKRLRIS